MLYQLQLQWFDVMGCRLAKSAANRSIPSGGCSGTIAPPLDFAFVVALGHDVVVLW